MSVPLNTLLQSTSGGAYKDKPVVAAHTLTAQRAFLENLATGRVVSMPLGAPDGLMVDADFNATSATLQNGFYLDAVPITAGRNLQLPSAANTVTAIRNASAGQMPNGGAWIDIFVSNLSGGANARTLVAGAGMTSTGSLVVAGGAAVSFRITIISATANAVHIARLG